MIPTYDFVKASAEATPVDPRRSVRRKANGPATAATLIQIATELLQASPTMRRKANISLTDLAAAEKVRRNLLKPGTQF